jgi:hypothetical protein
MKRPRRLLFSITSNMLVLLLASVSATAAKTYRWVDAQGVVHYSDTPQPGAEQITLPTAQGYTPVPAAPVAPLGAAADGATPASPPPDSAAYLSCAITEPVAETSLFSPESVHVAVGLDPPLREGDRLQVLLDGQPLELKSPSATSLTAEQPDRGEHVLRAVVRDSTGKIVCSASAVTFYVQRPSLLSPQSAGKPH